MPKFKKRSIKCPHPGCGKRVVNAGELTQHMQASHCAATRHPRRSPRPEPADHERGAFDEHLQGVDDYEDPGQFEQRGNNLKNLGFTIYHPLLDGKSSLVC